MLTKAERLAQDRKAARDFLPPDWRLGKWVPVRKGRIDWHQIGVRDELFERQKGLCHWCGKPMSRTGKGDALATLEHLMPLGSGGRDHPENIRMAHKSCNERRGLG